MKFNRGSFFGRLLSAFFVGGFVPFLMLALLFVAMTRATLENTYERRAAEAVDLSASMFRSLLSDTAGAAAKLAAEPAVIAYCEGSSRSAAIISDVNRLIAAASGNTGLAPYVIPTDGAAPLSRALIPDEYGISSHGGWGMLGDLSRSAALKPTVVFAQPHPNAGKPTSLAIGTIVLGKNGRAGYLVIDIEHKLIEERIGLAAKSGGALTELVFADRTGCILYDMADSRREAAFYDPAAVAQKLYFTPTSPVTMGIEAFGLFPRKAVQDYAQRVIAMALAAAAASALIFIVVAIGLAKATSQPIHLLTLTMKDVSNGRLDISCPEVAGAHEGDEVATLIKQFNRMIARVNELVDSKVEQERNLRYAELKALQAQINPHFIYNTLNSIRSVAKLKGDKELAYISTSLARILREGSASEGSSPGSDYCSLGHSLDLARDYFTIEDWRWPGRFTLEESIDQSLLDARVPRLIVQPLVENALSHGLEGKPGPGTLAIRAMRENGDILVSIADNGMGIDAEKLAAIREGLAQTERGAIDLSVELTARAPAGLKGIGDRSGGSSAGIGLLNTHRRLRLIYGEGYGLAIISAPGAGTNVTIRIPYASAEGEPC